MSFPPSLDHHVVNATPIPLMRALLEIAHAQAAHAFPSSERRWKDWMIIAAAADAALTELTHNAPPVDISGDD
jgi:hypothetical protein